MNSKWGRIGKESVVVLFEGLSQHVYRPLHSGRQSGTTPDRAMTPSVGLTSLHILTCDAVYFCTWAPASQRKLLSSASEYNFCTLKKEAAGSSEADVTLYQSTRRDVPRKLDTDRREKLGIHT